MLNKKDWFTNAKERLVVLDVESIPRNQNILDIYEKYPEGFDDIVLFDSYGKLRKINSLNLSSLRSLLEYANYLEVSSKDFSREDLLDMVQMLEIAYKAQDKFVISILHYISVDIGLITDKNQIADILIEFEDSKSNGKKLISKTKKEIKKYIKKERRDNLE